MRRVVCAVLLALAAACGGHRPIPPLPEPATYTLDLTVVDDRGTRIAADVFVLDPPPHPMTGRRDRVEGRAFLQYPRLGYTLCAEADGYQRQCMTSSTLTAQCPTQCHHTFRLPRRTAGGGGLSTAVLPTLRDITWLHADVSGWRETSAIERVTTDNAQTCIDHTKAGRWPESEGAEGNPWVIAQVGGRWYAGTYEWLRPGQTCKGVTAADMGPHVERAPLATWRPQPGEWVGFLVSTVARDARRTSNERSNIHWLRWPGGPKVPDARQMRADFLTLRGASGRRLFTGEYAAYSAAIRAEIREESKARGYTHVWMNALYEAKAGAHPLNAPTFDFLPKPHAYRQYLVELLADGLTPVVVLGLEEAPTHRKRYPPTTFAQALARFVPTIDDVVGGYVLGVEVGEYWTESQQDQIGRALRKLTRKPILVHFNSGEYEPALRYAWCDGVAYQYGFGKSAQEVAARTRELAPKFRAKGKEFIAAEYAVNVEESAARALGAAAMDAGAHGFANGGR